MNKTIKFIESIKIEQNTPILINLHQNRINNTLKHHKITKKISLENIITDIKNISKKHIYKWRIVYSKNGIESSEIQLYKPKIIKQIKIIENINIKYPHKYLDRTQIENITKKHQEEIIFTQKGYITDSTFSNIALYDGNKWYTPNTYLLNGIQRQHLINTHKIQEKEISIHNIHLFKKIKLINAMLNLENSPEYTLDTEKNIFVPIKI